VTLTVAATSTNTPGMSVIPFILFALIVTVGYGLACWLKPFALCHRCKGKGSSARRLSDRLRYGPAGKPRAARSLPDCPRCRGTGLRLRIGRRAANHLIRLHRRSH
jgi:hypothetical protein